MRLDPHRKTITLLRPLLLDLGAVAKGLAIDMAARELRPFAHFAINAGGDVYVGGRNAQGAPWSVGIRHPRVPGALFDTLRVSDCAVCTSGDYERRCPAEIDAAAGGHHILDPQLDSLWFGVRGRERDRRGAHRDAGGRAGHGGIRSWS